MILAHNIRQFVKNIPKIYNKSLIRYPYLTQSIQVSLMMGGSDIIAQTLIEKNSLKSLNIRRTLEFSCIGFCLVGPCLRYWYGKLDRLPLQIVWQKTIIKVLCDQILFAPIFIGIFITTLSFIQGNNFNNTKERLINEYPNILIGNYIIWPLAQLINFRLIPLNYQVVFVQMIAIIWNTYLSLKLGHKNQKE